MNKHAKLLILDGLDSSGKASHIEMLYDKLKKMGKKVWKFSFPNYESDSSALVKMYLAGDFGDKANEVNPFAASSFYTVDRYASFKQTWESIYNDPEAIILLDRYASSNMIHQTSKFTDPLDQDWFLSWLDDLEFNKFGLPRPDKVFLLDMPPSMSIQLMQARANKITGEQAKDIHEKDSSHLFAAYKSAKRAAAKFNWTLIACVEGETLRSLDEINDTIMEKILNEIS